MYFSLLLLISSVGSVIINTKHELKKQQFSPYKKKRDLDIRRSALTRLTTIHKSGITKIVDTDKWWKPKKRRSEGNQFVDWTHEYSPIVSSSSSYNYNSVLFSNDQDDNDDVVSPKKVYDEGEMTLLDVSKVELYRQYTVDMLRSNIDVDNSVSMDDITHDDKPELIASHYRSIYFSEFVWFKCMMLVISFLIVCALCLCQFPNIYDRLFNTTFREHYGLYEYYYTIFLIALVIQRLGWILCIYHVCVQILSLITCIYYFTNLLFCRKLLIVGKS